MEWNGSAYTRTSAASDSLLAATRLGSTADFKTQEFDVHEQLEASIRTNGALLLAVEPRSLARAPAALKARYGVEPFNVTAKLITAMRSAAEDMNIDWTFLLKADALFTRAQRTANSSPNSSTAPSMRSGTQSSTVPSRCYSPTLLRWPATTRWTESSDSPTSRSPARPPDGFSFHANCQPVPPHWRDNLCPWVPPVDGGHLPPSLVGPHQQLQDE